MIVDIFRTFYTYLFYIMYLYFSSDRPAVLKLGGIYCGKIFGTVKSYKTDADNPPLAEILPLGENVPPIAFFPDKDFLSAPPDNVTVTDLKGGFLIKISLPAECSGFRVIKQQKYRDLVATAFTENGYKLSLETPSDFLAEPIPFTMRDAEFFRFYLCGEELLAVAFYNDDYEERETVLCVYSFKKEIRKLFCRTVAEFSAENGLITTETHKDMAKHKVVTEWTYDGVLKEKNRTVTRADDFSRTKLHDKLLPYAFAEEFLCGGDFTEYLSGTVLDNADKLGGFLGDFIGVMPPPVFREENEVGFVYRTGERTYSAEYFVFEVSDKKITNLKKL